MKPVVLAVLDGWGYSKEKSGNAILSAQTPTINLIERNYPFLLLQASGKGVGLEWGESGNSEVGHLTLGAGRVIFQYFSRINRAIKSGEFKNNPAFSGAIENVKQKGSKLHIIGLLTSGSVHSYFDHLVALIDLAKDNQIEQTFLHLFTDGKDSGLKETPQMLEKLKPYLNEQVKIASFIGRDYAMDRDNHWDLTQAAYDLWTQAKGESVSDPREFLKMQYEKGVNDSKIPPLNLESQGTIADNDSVIFFNFREDSMRQITRAFVEEDLKGFPRDKKKNIYVASMTQFVPHPDLHVAFPPPEVSEGLAEVLSKSGKKQLHIAETEKYAHTTFFFNCLHNESFPGEKDELIPSLENSVEHPEMKALEIGQKVAEEIDKGEYDFIIINFANGDILSHAGNFNAAVKGIETIDKAVDMIMKKVLEKGGALLITADHGNAESLIYKATGDIETRHNQNPVPFYLVANKFQREKTNEEILAISQESKGLLADVAPTILELLEIPKPESMSGESLIPLLS